MKKFLVLALVIGIASFASAGVELAADDVTDGPMTVMEVMPGMIEIGLVSDAPAAGFDALYFIKNAKLTDPVDLTGGMFSTISRNDVIGGYQMNAGTFGAPIAAGKWFTLMIDGAEGDMIELWSSDATGLEPGELLDTINVIPEPMTMALLGLGGLFLRRRK